MTTVHAYAATEAGGQLNPFEYTLPELPDDHVDIRVETCGICHSDLSMLNNEWGMTAYPFVPGHEAVGVVKSAGRNVPNLKEGDRVGVGWYSNSCQCCSRCMSGDQNYCGAAEATIVGRHGGFADTLRSHWSHAIKLPTGVSAPDAGPLLCGGITVFNPMVQFDVRPTDRVGVIGIGGLGHLALKFLSAWGCEVTAFTSTGSKMEEAKQLGAHRCVNSRDDSAIEAEAERFDYIISTVNVPLNWNLYVNALNARGKLHMVGAAMEPLDIATFPLLMRQRMVSGSGVGSPATIATMLEFCARHSIAPKTEHFPMSKVNDAMQHLRDGKARYRIVLDAGS